MILTTLGISVAVILFLTFVIVGAEYTLVNREAVKIIVNNDEAKALTVESGKTLLNTLSGQGILLPSACGGGGTCGVCKCRVEEGGGDLLPTETTHINRKMAKEGYRLACQVKVKENMRIRIPEEVFSIQKWECRVVSNRNVATYIKEFVVQLPEGERLEFQSGGYIQIEAPACSVDFSKDIAVEDEYRDEWEDMDLFSLKTRIGEPISRAYSMANHPAEGNIIKLNVRIATPPWDREKRRFRNVSPGLMSSFIFSRKPGDAVTISGPYGEFFMQDTDREMMYIGGGAGMAPMRSHIFHLFHTLKTKRKVSFWYGARSEREIFYDDEFEAIEKKFRNFSFNVALSEVSPESQWKGYTGFIHQVIYEKYLNNHPTPEDIEYYLCGPPVMIDAVVAMLSSLGVEPEMIRYDKF
ncbi:MAG: NADH:ubiquinone reductase (Na(+)-transporting) subunit F [Spirochaetae bacterium HGW-Spirochaetae-1]|nr:MAG: NADH:ubiquinone reductase (Na(+)-transporting) subunit F [Spirochaetae bacterium HGW-Spirochaetae-1]